MGNGSGRIDGSEVYDGRGEVEARWCTRRRESNRLLTLWDGAR